MGGGWAQRPRRGHPPPAADDGGSTGNRRGGGNVRPAKQQPAAESQRPIAQPRATGQRSAQPVPRRTTNTRRPGGSRYPDGEPTVNPDDVLVEVSGLVDVHDSYAFVRTTGYLSGPSDVYVSMSQIKKYGLRPGDAVTGAARTRPDDGRDPDQRRDKY